MRARRQRPLALWALAGLAVAAASLLWSAPAKAHGERAQVSFLRTRTITFYDVRFSATRLAVGDRFSITGRFHVRRGWPQSVRDPETAALTVASLGPVVLVKNREIDGRFVPQSIALKKGHSYRFRIDLQARRSGFYHVHPMIALEGAGPLVGPGRWLRIAPAEGGGDFRNEATLRSGERIDLETYNRDNALVWHMAFLIPAGLFLLYWLRKPLARRLALSSTGTPPEELITSRDLKFSGAFGALSLAVLVAGMAYALSEWPDTIPLQVRKSTPPGEPVRPDVAASVVGQARFKDPDEVMLRLRLENRGREPLRLESFDTGSGDVRFTRAGRRQGSEGLLRSQPAATLAPKQREEVRLTLISERWSEDNLVPENEVEVAIGALLVLRAPDDEIRPVELTIPVIPEGGHH